MLRYRQFLETYNPNEPREPKGSSKGGEWTSDNTSQVKETGYGKVYINPTRQQVMALCFAAKEHDNELRFSYIGKNCYVWDASLASHNDMLFQLGFPRRYQGNLTDKSRMDFGVLVPKIGQLGFDTEKIKEWVLDTWKKAGYV